jgi:DUF971 family protein
LLKNASARIIGSMTPVKITLHKLSRVLELEFENGETFNLPCTYLRAFSTSAEQRLENSAAKAVSPQVNILAIERVGNYAIKPIFSDGHRTGIYTWARLYELGKELNKNWNHHAEK